MRDYDIKSDLKQEQFQTFKLVQGDRGNKIKINVFEEGQPVDLAGCSITAKYKRADGEVINNGIIEQEFSSDENFNINYFYAVMDSDITKVAGTLKMIFSIEKDDVKVGTFLLLADVREGIGENTGSSGGNTGDSTGEVTIDLSEYYKKSETYSKEQIDSQFKKNQINLIEDDTSTAGISDSVHDTLNTNDKTIIGAINEVNTQCADIANKIESGNIGGEVPDNIVLFEETSDEEATISAENIPIKDTTGNFTATNVEGALSELFQSASNGKQLIATAITGKGVDTSSSDTFEQMATNIGQIQTGSTGITPSGTINITSNGTFDVTNYANAVVNITASGNSIESGSFTPSSNSETWTINTTNECKNIIVVTDRNFSSIKSSLTTRTFLNFTIINEVFIIGMGTATNGQSLVGQFNAEVCKGTRNGITWTFGHGDTATIHVFASGIKYNWFAW